MHIFLIAAATTAKGSGGFVISLQSDGDKFLSGRQGLVRLISVEIEVDKSLQFIQSSERH